MNSEGREVIALAALLTALISFGCFTHPDACTRFRHRFRHLARRRTVCVVAAALLPVAIRLLLLPWFPAPEPRVPDEFSHLLVAETLASGRLANPPHPLSRHFETVYVLQQPTRSSIYPIGHGSVLAAGQLLAGHPWPGVLLSVALMSRGITWMLFGCLPASWAAAGGLLAALHFGLAPQWVDSYWGGAFCAFGGALFFGALVRLRQRPSVTMGASLGLGWSIVWLIRPFESLLLFLVAWVAIVALGASAFVEPRQRRRWVAPAVLLASVQLLAGAITLVHNRAVTGSFLTLPYQLSRNTYGTPQSFFWQAAVPPTDVRAAELRSVYEWQRKQKEDLDEHPFRQFVYVVKESWRFYVTPWYSAPLFMLLFSMRDPKVVLGGSLIACALVVSTLYPFFYPHYAGAYAGVIFFLIVRGMIRLSSSSIRDAAAGRAVVLFVVLGGAMTALPFAPVSAIRGVVTPAPEPAGPRTQLSSRLAALRGRHMVFVRYGPDHSFHDEWVYNAANVDESPIVWGRAIGAAEDAAAMRYYSDRQAWLAIVNGNAVHLSRYEPDGASQGVARR